jgi:endonuclease/exonuclease/phosphatase family metal-dependent hydrolase
VFHGNTDPPERKAYLEEMIRLATADRPDLLCLQELPAWADVHLPVLSGMQAYADLAQMPRLGPIPIPAERGRRITTLHHGFFRSAVDGQANAILLAPEAEVLSRHRLVLNCRDFRKAQSRWLSLPLSARLAWAEERRIVQAVRARFPGGLTLLVANLHATSYPADQRLADGELLRAAVFADGLAQPGDIVVLAGDFNVPATRSATQAVLTSEDWGFSVPVTEGIDQILVRGVALESVERWPRERRRVGGRVLSDHTPVDARTR